MSQQPPLRPLRVLLVDESPRRSSVLAEALRESGCDVLATVPCGVDLYAALDRTDVDVVIVDMESPDRDMLEDMHRISAENPHPIVMFVNDDDPDAMRAAVRAGVAGYVVRGADRERVRSVLDVAIARFEEVQALRTELQRAKASLEERKLVEQAKGLLMAKRGMAEEEAYKALRQMAMNRNLRLVEVARSVLNMAELL